jgi:hypothetical protein
MPSCRLGVPDDIRAANLDPFLPVGFLQSGLTRGDGSFAFRFYEAAVRDLPQPARSGRWRSAPTFPCRIAAYDRFSAVKLSPALALPGQQLPLGIPARITHNL